MNGSLFPTHPQVVLAAVADAFHITVAELVGESQHRRPYNRARPVAARLLREECWYTWRQVAEAMNRSHRSAGYISMVARDADPATLEAVRVRLHPNGHQPELF